MNTSELKQLIKEEFSKISVDSDYTTLNILEQNLFESYWLLGELLNPNNAYEYSKVGNGFWVFEDSRGYDYFVRVLFQPTNEGYLEVKMGWVDLPKQEKYLQQPNREIDEGRSDTIAKIYRDEIIPFFQNQNLNNTMVISPLDIKRYQFSIRLVRKYTPNSIEIIEDKPNTITLKNKNK